MGWKPASAGDATSSRRSRRIFAARRKRNGPGSLLAAPSASRMLSRSSHRQDNMRVGVVTEAVPNPGTSGGDTVNWAILKHLREAGHEVSPCCLLINQWAAERPEALRRHVSALEGLGVHPQVFRIPEAPTSGWLARRRQAVWPDAARLYPAAQPAPQLRQALETAQPDAVFVFDSGPMAAMRDVRVAPRFVVPGDP